MKIKTLLLSVIVAFGVMGQVQADSLSKARELMEAMELTKTMEDTFAQMEGFAEQMVDAQGLPEEEAKKAKEIATTSMKASFEAVANMDWGEMFADVYASVFTEDELQGLIDFYHSTLGKKFLEKQPELMAATMEKMQVEMAKIMPQIQADIQKAIEAAQSE